MSCLLKPFSFDAITKPEKMKRTLLSALAICAGLSAQAQLADGSTAPDFTLTDIDGVSHNLYTYLNAGKTVYIDVSATWCGPCWNYHNSHALDQLWAAHGPTGAPGVNANTTNDVIVLFIEGDGSTNSADLNGTGGNTQGDWVTDVEHPIIDPAAAQANAFNSDYAIGYFPTIYMICPARSIYEVGQQTAANLYAARTTYNCFSATGANNPALTTYTGETSICASTDVTATLQNLGTNALTSATIQLKQGTTVLNTINWTGNLATYATEEVNLGSVNPSSPTTYTILISSTDDDASNNTLSQLISPAPASATTNVTINIITDAYGSETTWTLKNSSGTTVASGGPYGDLQAAGTTTQPAVNATLVNGECYTMKVMDSYGDGMDSGYGAGSFNVKDGNNNVLVSGGDFTDEASGKLRGPGTAGIEEGTIAEMNVFPNPASSVVNVAFEAENTDYTVSVLDLQGRVVVSTIYTNLNGYQSIEIPVSELMAGNYFISVSSGVATTQKMITIK